MPFISVDDTRKVHVLHLQNLLLLTTAVQIREAHSIFKYSHICSWVTNLVAAWVKCCSGQFLSNLLLQRYQDGRVVKALDLSFNGRMSAWVQTPLLVNSAVSILKPILSTFIERMTFSKWKKKQRQVLKFSPLWYWPVCDAAHVDLQAAVVSQVLLLHLDQVHTLAVHSD